MLLMEHGELCNSSGQGQTMHVPCMTLRQGETNEARKVTQYWELLLTSTAGDVSPIRPNIWLCKFGVSQAVYMSVIVTTFTIGLWCSLCGGGDQGQLILPYIRR